MGNLTPESPGVNESWRAKTASETSEEMVTYAPLTPTAFLDRSALVYADRPAVVDGDSVWTYREFHGRARKLAGALLRLGLEPGGRVAVLAPNTHMLLEAHFGVPLAGGVLVALNVRLRPEELARAIEHSGATVLLYDERLAASAQVAMSCTSSQPHLIDAGELQSSYEVLLAGNPEMIRPTRDERSLLSINYTSGTTGAPKGVMYSHRGAYLQALAMAFHSRLEASSAFLWTLPMFHCNGWCFPWAVTAAGACHVCMPTVSAEEAWRLIVKHRVSHLNGAPTLLTMLAHSEDARRLDWRLRVATGGSPPSPTLLARLSELSMDVTHLYGLTETFGPVALCEWQPEWDGLPPDEKAVVLSRQGVGNVIACPLRVIDEGGHDVPTDGTTVGEIAVRGNDVMMGYFRDPEASAAATLGGWFRTGDLAIMHPDGYVEICDRAKDIIITGGENVSSVEVERVLASHPGILEAAVVSVPDDLWGEIPVAYVTPKSDEEPSESTVIEFVRARLSHFKCPKQIFFGELPKTSTGKIEKFVLRERAASERARSAVVATNLRTARSDP